MDIFSPDPTRDYRIQGKCTKATVQLLIQLYRRPYHQTEQSKPVKINTTKQSFLQLPATVAANRRSYHSEIRLSISVGRVIFL